MPAITNGESGASARGKINTAIAVVDGLGSGDNLLLTAAERAKLTGVEAGATADMSAAEIKTAYESNADTNAFTDAEKAKLTGVEAGATADMTGAEIKAAYEAEVNTNAFTDAEKTKLTGIEIGATADMTGAEIKAAYEAEANTNAFTDAEKMKLAGLETSKYLGTFVNITALQTAHPLPVVGSYAHVDAGIGSDVQVYIWDNDDGQYVVQAGTGTSETAASIKTKYESNADTNAFTDAEKTKLAGVATGATANTGALANKDFVDTGDVTDNAMTNAKLAQVVTGIIKGRATAGNGNVEDLTPTQVTALLNSFTSVLKGLVPASGGGTTNYLRADGSWADPAGGSNPVTVGSGVPATAPASVGLLYVDDSNYNLYYSKGVATASDWVLVIDNDAGVTLTSKTTPVLADEVMHYNSENGFEAVTSTWTQIIAALKLVTLDASNRLVNPKSIYTSFDGGSPTAASTYTPAAVDGNVQHITNNAAFTLAPPATLGSFAIEIVNGATAGAITTSGFTKVSGDALTTTNGHKFIAQIVKTNSVSHLNITAMQ